MLKKIIYIVTHPIFILYYLDKYNIIRINDELYLKLRFQKLMNKKLDLDNPKTFSEKLQWLKLYDRNPLYTKLVDKYEVKKYVSKIIGSKYLIPTIGVYNNFNEINFDELPNKFIIKCTHDSGGNVIVDDKNNFDLCAARKKINKCLKNNFYYDGREWPYKNVKHRIIIEEYMEDKIDNELRDYKFFVINGKVRLLFVASNRQGDGDTYFDFFDIDYNHLNLLHGHPNAPTLPHKPYNFELMKQLAEKLANNIPEVRVDFYEVNKKIYFGEMTFFHHSGTLPFEPEIWDEKLGELLILPEKK